MAASAAVGHAGDHHGDGGDGTGDDGRCARSCLGSWRVVLSLVLASVWRGGPRPPAGGYASSVTSVSRKAVVFFFFVSPVRWWTELTATRAHCFLYRVLRPGLWADPGWTAELQRRLNAPWFLAKSLPREGTPQYAWRGPRFRGTLLSSGLKPARPNAERRPLSSKEERETVCPP